jgi:cytochrome c6
VSATRWVVSAVGLMLIASLHLPARAEEPAKDEGQELYAKKCALCHGASGVAKKAATGSANLNDPAWQKATDDATIAAVIRDGKDKMPKFAAKLTAEQIQAIIREIRKLK